MRNRLIFAIDFIVRRTGAIATLAFTCIVVYAVAARYLFGRTPPWAEELPRMLLVWVCFIGAVSCFARNSHFRAGFMPLIFKSSVMRRALGMVSLLATLALLAVLVKTGWDLTRLTWSNKTTALQLPVGLFYLALPVCCAVAGLVVLLRRDTE